MTDHQADAYDHPTIVELMGHRKLAGRVREVTLAGMGMLRLDIPATPGHGPETQYINPSSVYALHPTTEEIATAAAARFRPAPISRWELENPPALSVRAQVVDEDPADASEYDRAAVDQHDDYGF